MSDELNVLVCQLCSIDDVESNLEQIRSLIASVPAKEKIDLICLPENSLYLRVVEGQKIPGIEIGHPAFDALSEICKQRHCYMQIGSVPLCLGGKLANASVLLEPQGSRKKSYVKIHLFDIEIEGQKPIKESDVFHHGDTPELMAVNNWKLGQSICYDLRFAELFSYYASQEVDAVLVPSAFLVETGKAHWEVLLRARAIESQCYVIAAAQAGVHTGTHGGERKTYGHSLVVDPWGTIIWQASQDKPEAHLIKLFRSQIAKVRRQIPMRNHRRLSR